MQFHVSEVRQTSSAADYVVKYSADIEFRTDTLEIEIEVVSTNPPNANVELLHQAIEYTRRGAEAALGARGFGAVLRLRNIVVHDVDFHAPKFEAAIIRALERLDFPTSI